MEIEIKANEYETPAQLAHEIRSKVCQFYVDWVWVKFAKSRHKVTPVTAENVCKGLMMADELSLDQIDAEAEILKWSDRKPDSAGWWWEWTGDISDAPEIVCVVSIDPLRGFYRNQKNRQPLDGGPFYAGPIPLPNANIHPR